MNSHPRSPRPAARCSLVAWCRHALGYGRLASDSSGVQYARVYVDGTQVAQQASSCDFTLPAPCPASSSSQFSLDTRTLSNGSHQIQAAVVDAAGNQTLGSPVQVTVDNTNPSDPTGLQINGHSSWRVDQPARDDHVDEPQPAPGRPDRPGQLDRRAQAARRASPRAAATSSSNQSGPLSSLTFNPAQDPPFVGQPQGVYTVFVWLQDALGNTSQADSAAISFGYQTSPPPPPTSIAVSGRGPYTITLGAPMHLGADHREQLERLQQHRGVHADANQPRPVVRVRARPHVAVPARSLRPVHDPCLASRTPPGIPAPRTARHSRSPTASPGRQARRCISSA